MIIKHKLIWTSVILIVLTAIIYLLFFAIDLQSGNSEGSAIKECPVKVYQVGESLRCPIDIQPGHRREFKDSRGCKYIIYNDCENNIVKGQNVEVVYQSKSDRVQYLEVDDLKE